MSSRNLDELRELIDRADDEILEGLNRRATLVEEVRVAKRKVDAEPGTHAFYRPDRERAIIERLESGNPGPFPSHSVARVFREVISACRALQSELEVAYLGPEASFTHQAVARHFGSSARAIPCGSVAAVFDEVRRSAADYGVVPAENSIEGVVTHTLDAIVGGDLMIIGEVILPIEHCLLVREGVAERNIVRVYSHPQAFAQCRRWLSQNLSRATLVESPSTAEAAISAHADTEGAAIAAELASRTYNLEVLRTAIQDQTDNSTRFFVIGREAAAQSASGEHTTTVALTPVDTGRAGTLYRMLRPLSDADINLTKIESRPSRRRPWEYIFIIDIVGHRDEPSVAAALKTLADQSEFFQILGSYRRAMPGSTDSVSR